MSPEISEVHWPSYVDPELRSRILDVIVKEGMVDPKLITPGVTLEELQFDSLEAVMIVNGLEIDLGVQIGSDLQLGDAKTLSDLVALLAEGVKRAPSARQP